MTERAWKRSERRVAELLGGRRVPVSGRQRGDAPDIAHPVFAVEVKTRKTLPAWLRTAMAQAVAAQCGEQIPVVVLHQAGDRYADDLVVVRMADWVARFGTLHRLEGVA